jgi:hypothetical protein
MEEIKCGSCAFRAKYDHNPRSFLGRLWRWHANWCPGWKAYMTSLPEQERLDLAKKYEMKKYLQ